MARYIDADELRNIILADKEKLFKLRNTCVSLSDEEVNDCQSYVYSRVLARMSECYIEDCSAEIEAMKIKLAQAMGLLELAVEDLSEYKRCLKCKHHKKNYGDCIGMNFCQKSEYHEKWQWKHADKLAELKGEL